MRKNRIFSLCSLAAVALLSFNTSAANIDAQAARVNANQFLKHQTRSLSFRSIASTDLKLAYAQPSSAVADAKSYYAFNIKGGGFVIVAGEDRARPILGYSDQGQLDFNNLPDNMQALLRSYQEEIDYLQTHPDVQAAPAVKADNGNGVAPLIKSLWGQEMPYYLQCPTYQGEYCVVGCVATAMTQVMHYWQFPTSSPEINSYYCYDIGQTLEELPATNFDYSKMLNSYCHWDWDNSQLVQDTYTDAQAQAVAKLARYCGQAVKMGYSPEGSGAYTSDQLDAMLMFGYSSSARDVSRSGWWGDEYYTTQEWEAMIKTELDAGRPILYSANDPAAGGHAFVCDGYNNEGLFHFNFGWYGTCNGWYASSALDMTHRDGDQLHFNYNHEMLIGIVPPNYCVITPESVTAPGELMVLGEKMDIEASNVSILTSHAQINVLFSLCNSTGRVMASTNAVNVVMADYQQGSDLNASLTLPTSLETGSYALNTYYYITMPRSKTLINCDGGQINVVGHLAKYNEPFNINDVTTTINHLLKGTYSTLSIDDVTALINHLLHQ